MRSYGTAVGTSTARAAAGSSDTSRSTAVTALSILLFMNFHTSFSAVGTRPKQGQVPNLLTSVS